MRRTVTSVGFAIALLCTAAPSLAVVGDDAEPAGALRWTGCDSPAPAGGFELDRDPPDVDAVSAVQVGPTQVELELAAGFTARPDAPSPLATCTITIRNRRAEATSFELVPVGAVGATGLDASTTYLDPDDDGYEQTAGPWLEPERGEFRLEPREVARVAITVRVPADAAPGGHYAAITVVPGDEATLQADDGSVLGVESRIAVPFLIRLGGAGEAKLELRDERAPGITWDREAWTWRAALHNDGTLHARPEGRVRIRSFFGSTVATLPLAGRTMLPGSAQPLEANWERTPWLGLYRVDVRVGDQVDDDAVATTEERWLLTLPPWWVVLAGALLVVAWLVARRRLRRDDDWDDNSDSHSLDHDHDHDLDGDGDSDPHSPERPLAPPPTST